MDNDNQNIPTNLNPLPPEPVLTDPVAPETPISEPVLVEPPVTPPPTLPSVPTPIIETVPTPAPETPASIPPVKPGSNPLPVIILALLAIGAIATAATIFMQMNTASKNLTTLQNIKKNQELPTTTPTTTPTPTTKPSVTTTPIPTVVTSPTPTPSIIKTNGSLNVIPQLDSVLTLAKSKIETAKLILVKVENVQSQGQATFKFWFRESDTKKAYFYILTDGTNEPKIFDSHIYVTPDNNIPSLNNLTREDAVIYDLEEVYNTALDTVIKNSTVKTQAVQVSAQFIQTKYSAKDVLLWELTLRFTDRSTPVVIQVNARTKEIIYANIKYTK